MKKGFTLIELLAVIVILAIIALIVSPTIIGLIDDARKQTFKNSAYGIIRSGEILYSGSLLDGTNEEVTFTYTDGVEKSDPDGYKLNYNGSKPKSGSVVINSEGQVALALHNGTYCTEKGYEDTEVTLSEKTELECKIGGATEIGYRDGSGASIPKLDDGMIPIFHNGTNWVKADTSQKWYDYNAKEWANVVLVREDTRDTYKNDSAGKIVNESDVLAYLVWIPRYKYKLFDEAPDNNNPPRIELVFEDKSATTNNELWLTHPAFWWDDDNDGERESNEEISGIWVGKFETGSTYNDCNKSTASTENDCMYSKITPLIKPNLQSITKQNIANNFFTAMKFNNPTMYGITSTYDAHMMKNMEWGAVAYLSHSQYGKEGEIYTNPSIDYITGSITGRGGENVSQANIEDLLTDQTELYGYDGKQCSTKTLRICTGPASEIYGIASSTTGNIYGIYDMSGGTYEYVMAGIFDSDYSTLTDSFETIPEGDRIDIDNSAYSKYVDKYDMPKDVNNFSEGKLGDATLETKGWYSDNASDVLMCILRGGGNFTGSGSGTPPNTDPASGLFAYTGWNGESFVAENTFRVTILKP